MVPKGHVIISQRFHRWESSHHRAFSPARDEWKDVAECQSSLRDYGLTSLLPSSELLGYFQSSLRDADERSGISLPKARETCNTPNYRVARGRPAARFGESRRVRLHSATLANLPPQSGRSTMGRGHSFRLLVLACLCRWIRWPTSSSNSSPR